MEVFRTPVKKLKSLQEVHIPASPLMKKIGFGTGIAVYEMQRSPVFDNSNSPWAVKKLIQKYKNNTELDNRLKEEAEVLRRLNHPHIVGFRAFVKDNDGKNVLAMEECSYCLGNMIEERTGPFPSQTIKKVAGDIAKALDYLHNEVLLVHCDVKSYNILIKGDFCVCKLCDFGVCLPVTKTGDLDFAKADAEAEFGGTIAWAAPEVLRSPQEVTTKVDIYAFGLVLWEMIALSPPVDEDFINSFSDSFSDADTSLSQDDTMSEKSFRKRPALPDVDLTADYNPVLEIFYCCTNEDKDNRPTAKDLTIILKEISHDSNV